MGIDELFLILSNEHGIGIATVLKILDEYSLNKDVKSLVRSITAMKFKHGVRERLLEAISTYKKVIEKYKLNMYKNNIDLIDVDMLTQEYALNNIHNSPYFLYSIGNALDFTNCIGVVGARSCSEYGRKMAFKIGRELALNGYTVVSGMAYGVDSYAHKGALDANGATVAVLGSGVDVCYPKSNYALYECIKKDGLVLSEYGLGSNPTKYTFPQRNRIISGLCKAIIVVEAKQRSGTMITVKYALDEGRQVFAVPGNINSELSQGTNELIKCGAIPYTGVKDIINNVL